MHPEHVDCWKCSCCGRAYLERSVAERCCVCGSCGKEGTGNGLVECVECQHKKVEAREDERWKKAKKVSPDEYEGEMVYSEAFEEYLYDWDLESAREFFLEKQYPDEPEFSYDLLRLYGTERVMLGISPDSVFGTMEDMEPEDWSWDGEAYGDMERLCDEWNAKHASHVYYPDYEIGVTVGDCVE